MVRRDSAAVPPRDVDVASVSEEDERRRVAAAGFVESPRVPLASTLLLLVLVLALGAAVLLLVVVDIS